jgi:hypothetical protein
MIKTVAGKILGLLIGIGCRWFDIPLPGPPKLVEPSLWFQSLLATWRPIS